MRSPFLAMAVIEPKLAIYPVGKISESSCDLCLDSFFSNTSNDESFPDTSRELDELCLILIFVAGMPR